jgi:SAM-dependent methyltransferase
MREIKRAGITSPTGFLSEFVSAQDVLDVGVVEHTVSRTFCDTWKHRKIRERAARVVGVDIVEDAVLSLVDRGYDVRLVDATSDVDLEERFTRVVIGDVIEHVDNPVSLLRFAARHLKDEGLVLCTTPNPFFVGHLIRGFRAPPFVANGEHVSWITPTMALEIGRRAGLELVAYHHTLGSGSTLIRRQAVRVVRWLGQIEKEIFAGSYYYIFKKAA